MSMATRPATNGTPAVETLAGGDQVHHHTAPAWVLFVRRHPLACFFVLAYALSWALWLPLIVSGQIVVAGDGNPSHFPGLIGPALAAVTVTAITAGRAGIADLGRRMVRWHVGWRWYASVAVLPGFLAVAVTVNALVGNGWPHPADLTRYSGLPDVGLVGVYVLAVAVNGFGEETGWRGFALPQLQRRHRPLYASLLLAIGWAGWHLPLLFVLDSFRGFNPAMLPGFLIGLACGSIVLTYVYNGTGGSILLVALWHTTYNMATATGQPVIATMVSALVIAWAVGLVAQDVKATRGRRPSPLRIRVPSDRSDAQSPEVDAAGGKQHTVDDDSGRPADDDGGTPSGPM